VRGVYDDERLARSVRRFVNGWTPWSTAIGRARVRSTRNDSPAKTKFSPTSTLPDLLFETSPLSLGQ
jgi:hypothetical protein